jgi:predicted Zn-dependent protease
VLVPFWVPEGKATLGLGLALLLRDHLKLDVRDFRVAQLYGHVDDGPARIVEAMVTPEQWTSLARDSAPVSPVGLVMTGALEPPTDEPGHLVIAVFNPATGRHVAKAERELDEATAGATLVDALREVQGAIPALLTHMEPLGSLEWTTLEYLIRAEVAASHDPIRNERCDMMAALSYLGRAVDEQPDVALSAEKLATVALELGAGADPRLTAAALRTIIRALDDAPGRGELTEAASALLVLTGEARRAEILLNAAVALEPTRVKLYALLSMALRAQNQLEAARVVLDRGLEVDPNEPLLTLERGEVRFLGGDEEGAVQEWLTVLTRAPDVRAFDRLAALAHEKRNLSLGQTLVDYALTHSANAPPRLLRAAIQIAYATEAEDLARAARLDKLLRATLVHIPDDLWLILHLAQELVQLGKPDEALHLLDRVDAVASNTPLGAEAARVRFRASDREGAAFVDALLREVYESADTEIGSLVERTGQAARRYPVWGASLAHAIALARAGSQAEALPFLMQALKTGQGSPMVHHALGRVHAELGAPKEALAHAERAVALGGDAPAVFILLGEVLARLGRLEEARAIATQLEAAGHKDLMQSLESHELPKGKPPLVTRLRETYRRWLR